MGSGACPPLHRPNSALHIFFGKRTSFCLAASCASLCEQFHQQRFDLTLLVPFAGAPISSFIPHTLPGDRKRAYKRLQRISLVHLAQGLSVLLGVFS